MKTFVLLSITFLYLLVTSYFYFQRISAFGCFDDCFNFGAGYFITEGKKLFTDFLFNHQPLMAYVSALLQAIFQPDTLYQFLQLHRIAVLLFSFVMSLLIVYRFGLTGFFFVALYESTKFYVFGDRFLAESFIVYLLVYSIGIVLKNIKKEVVRGFDIIFASIALWFIIFSREPFVPIGIMLLIFFVWKNYYHKSTLFAGILFLTLSAITILYHSVPDYFFNVFTINAQGAFYQETSGQGVSKIMQSFTYPLQAVINSKNTILGNVQTFLGVIFLVGWLIALFKRNYILSLFILISLFLTNLRPTTPGVMYYEAFHMAPWYGIFVFYSIYLLSQLITEGRKKLHSILLCMVVFAWAYTIVSPQSFFNDKIDKTKEFTTHYAHYFVQGDVIKRLAFPTDTLFVDGFDEMIHWQAKLPTSYTYTWYTSFMPDVDKTARARIEMFEKNPPLFYYGSCPLEIREFRLLPLAFKKDYKNLLFSKKPSCIFVHVKKLKSITSDQLKSVEELGFSF